MVDADRAALLAADREARSQALDVTRSFIVQAPAGSGKTELLIQRLLAVLAAADEPGEVLAITFTNKAAGEMRERLHSALLAARDDPDGVAITREVERQRHRLALAVLARDHERGWKLLGRPEALLIDTFDAFCARIAARAPLRDVAANAALAPITDQPDAILRDAAREALFDPDVAAEAGQLLRLAANRVDEVIELLADLLARRAQWLGEAVDVSDTAVERLTATLAGQIERRLSAINQGSAVRQAQEIRELAAYTAGVFERLGRHDEAERRTAFVQAWPAGTSISDLWAWRVLADLLLTSADELRKPGGIRVDAGFPAASSKDFPDLPKSERDAMKARMQALLANFEGEPAFVQALAQTRMLPTAEALADHAVMLRATLVILRQAAAHLSLQLRERGVADFSAVVLAASAALIESREEVLAGLDARLAHVLVDEVQDTNPAQFELLAALSSDWSPGDGRTMFLVGDPMQSIYSFRDADVSLFLRAQQRGVGGVSLQPVTLSANYRSQPAIVDWVNAELSQVFGRGQGDGDDAAQQVSYSPAVANNPSGTRVETVEALDFADEQQEAAAVAERIAALRGDEPDASAAVLVRSRAHGTAIIAELLRRGIPFAAREFADWSQRETIRDLLALTCSITAPGDRLSLFAVLRSPWVGCTLQTLHALSLHLDGAGRDETALIALNNLAWQPGLDDDARARLAHAAYGLAVAEARAWLSPLSERVEATWLALGGKLALDASGLHEAEEFFRWLEQVASGGLLPPRHELETLLAAERQSFSATAGDTAATAAVEILTVHKAKGLEWDHVYLPGADRATRADHRSLAQWRFVDAPTVRDPHARAVLIAARDTRRREAGSVYDFVAAQRAAARRAEAKRLLYVAATRARRRLTLTRVAAHKAAPAESFAGLLGYGFDESLQPDDPGGDARLRLTASLRRGSPPAASDEAIRRPAYPPALADASVATPQNQLDARAQGIVGHLLFEGLALAAHAFAPRAELIERQLAGEGAAPAFAQATAARLAHWFAGAGARANVQFLFAATHTDVANELTLATAGGELLRLDRTFVAATGERWLIDYKFSEPPTAIAATGNLDTWLATESAQYLPQLRRYATLLRALDQSAGRSARVRVALYFPWIDVLHELDDDGAT